MAASGRIFAAPSFADGLLVLDPGSGALHARVIASRGLKTGEQWNACSLFEDALHAAVR